MADKYRNFAALARQEEAGVDYAVSVRRARGEFALVAPHGGGIEPGTTELADAIATDILSFYTFEGLKSSGNTDLHITSTRFDEPMCLTLLGQTEIVVTLHGEHSTEDGEGVFIGGRLGYTLFYNLPYYLQHPVKFFAVWEGGMSFHGGLLGTIVSLVWFSKRQRIPIYTIADLAASVTPRWSGTSGRLAANRTFASTTFAGSESLSETQYRSNPIPSSISACSRAEATIAPTESCSNSPARAGSMEPQLTPMRIAQSFAAATSTR